MARFTVDEKRGCDDMTHHPGDDGLMEGGGRGRPLSSRGTIWPTRKGQIAHSLDTVGPESQARQRVKGIITRWWQTVNPPNRVCEAL